jgi:transposase
MDELRPVKAVDGLGAARHGLQANLLSTWRRQAKPAEQRCRVRRAVEPPAVTVTVSTEVGGTAGLQADIRSVQDMQSPSVPVPSLIEIMLADASIRVAPGVDIATLSRVLAAVRRGGR